MKILKLIILKENLINKNLSIELKKSFVKSEDLYLEIIDGLFDKYKDEGALITVYQTYKGLDDRLIMLCFNNELTSWLIEETPKDIIFEEQVIEQLFQIHTDRSFDVYIEEFTNFLKVFPMKNKNYTENDFYVRYIQTIFGSVKLKIRLNKFEININGVKLNFICSFIRKEEQNEYFNAFLKIRKIKNKENGEKLKKSNLEWGKLLEYYYKKKI